MKKLIVYLLFPVFISTVSAQHMDWVSLPQELDGDVTAMAVYKDKLVVGGRFKQAGGLVVNGIAAWDGNTWTSFANGLTGNLPLVNKMIEYNNELFVMGRFDSAGNVAAKNIARWNGTEWLDAGANPNNDIRTSAVFNGILYIAGNFDTLGQQAVKCIARWKDNSWQPVSSGLEAGNIIDLYVYKNELFATGQIALVNGFFAEGIARWNDTAWRSISTGFDYTGSAMIEWNQNLVSGSTIRLNGGNPGEEIKQWNGTEWSRFSIQDMSSVLSFLVFDNRLYCSTRQWEGEVNSSAVLVWDSVAKLWNELGTGTNGYTPALCAYKDELYCGGDFNKKDSANHNYIARFAATTGVNLVQKSALAVKVFPNPASQAFVIHVNNPENKAGEPTDLYIYEVTGRLVYHKQFYGSRETITDFEGKGIFTWKLQHDEQTATGKIILE